MISLYALQGPDKGRRFDLANDEQVNLGRASEQVPLTDLTVSRKHAMLERRQEGWIVFDLGSSNGVFINGVRVQKQKLLKLGDQIRMGSTLLVFGSPAQSVITVSDRAPQSQRANLGDSSIITTVPSNDDSVILAAPEPSAAAMVHFRVLLQTATAISSIFDLDPLLNKVMDLVFEHLRADRGFIALLDDKPGNSRAGGVVPSVVRYRDESDPDKIAVSQTIIQHVLSKNEGVLASNAMTDQRFSKGKSVHSLMIRSAICVPIRGREKILGVIHIDTMVANYTYTADQLRLLTAIGLQTGMAIENATVQEGLKRERLAAAGETVASLSHSIKNILQGIRGGADVVDMALRRNAIDDVRTGWKMLQRNLDKVHTLTLNMLAYAKPRVPTLELTNLPHVLSECLELVRPLARDKRVELLTEISETLPPIPLDADGIHQAVLNLLTNAIEAVEPRRGVVTLSSEFDAISQETLVEVQDNGVGINSADLEKLFQPFYSTKGQRGTGLGLAVTKKIIEEHAGRIEIQSKLGQGTTFRLCLPFPQRLGTDTGETQSPK